MICFTSMWLDIQIYCNHLLFVSRYGRIRDIDIKTPSRPPAFAFVSFEYKEDADAAIRGRY